MRRRARAESEQRFRLLFERHWRRVTAYSRRRCPDTAAADDVVAEVFLIAWKRIADIPLESELPWLLGVARRVIANRRRSDWRRENLMARLERDASLRLDASALHPAETVASDVVRAALERLRPVDAEMLRLATWEELSHGEIAVIFRCSVNAVGVRLHRARQRLAVELEKDGMTSLKVTKGAHSAGLRPESDPVESASEWSS